MYDEEGDDEVVCPFAVSLLNRIFLGVKGTEYYPPPILGKITGGIVEESCRDVGVGVRTKSLANIVEDFFGSTPGTSAYSPFSMGSFSRIF